MHRQLHKSEKVEAASLEDAERYLRKMYLRLVSGWGGCTQAVENIAKRCGLTTSQIRHILNGRTKTVNLGHYAKIRAAYVSFIKEERAVLDAEIAEEDEKTKMFEPVDFMAEIDALRARFELIKGGLAQ